jgi:hypothetical protein
MIVSADQYDLSCSVNAAGSKCDVIRHSPVCHTFGHVSVVMSPTCMPRYKYTPPVLVSEPPTRCPEIKHPLSQHYPNSRNHGSADHPNPSPKRTHSTCCRLPLRSDQPGLGKRTEQLAKIHLSKAILSRQQDMSRHWTGSSVCLLRPH